MSKRMQPWILGTFAALALASTGANASAADAARHDLPAPYPGKTLDAPISVLLSTLSQIPDTQDNLRIRLDRETSLEIKGSAKDIPSVINALSRSTVLEQVAMTEQTPDRYRSGYQEFTITAVPPPLPLASKVVARLSEDTALATGVLRERINARFGTRSGLQCQTLHSQTVLGREPGTPYIAMDTRMRCAGTYKDLITSIRDLERDPLQLHIRELSVYPLPTLNGPVLDVRFSLAGFQLGE